MMLERLGNRASQTEGSPNRLLWNDGERNMAPDERSRVEASQALTDQLGPAAAAALMECIPPFGWHEIATKSDLLALERRFEAVDRRFEAVDRRFDGLERSLDALERGFDGLEEHLGFRFDARLHAEMNRVIRWTVASIFGGITALSAAAAAAAALLA